MLRTVGVFLIVYFGLSVVAAAVGFDRAPYGLLAVGLAVAAAVLYRRRSGGASRNAHDGSLAGVSQGSGFRRRSYNLSGDANAHHFVAMRAKEDGDYEKTINVALDMWDRFGLSYLVADALQDGFIVWAKASQYQSEDAANLALDLHRRARMELPASLSEVLAEPNPPHPDIPSDPVGDWVLLFKQAELFSGAIAPERLRMTAGELFDGLCRLPPTKRRDYQSLLGRLHEKYGVGDMGAAQDGVYS